MWPESHPGDLEKILPVVREALEQAHVGLRTAAVRLPYAGLSIVDGGVTAAKTLAFGWNKPWWRLIIFTPSASA